MLRAGRPRRLTARSVALAALLGWVALATAPPGVAAGGRPMAASKPPVVTFGVEPYSADPGVTRPYFDVNASPGAHIHDTAAVLNYSNQPLTLGVSAADAVNTSAGGFGLVPATTSNHGVASWIQISSRDSTVSVPPRKPGSGGPGRVLVPLTVVVPASATPGEHVGGIVVTLQSSVKSDSGQLFHLNQRVGSRVFVKISGTLQPRLTVEGLAASYHSTASPIGKGSVTVTYRVVNTGNVALGGRQAVSVRGLLGRTVTARSVAQVPLLVPGGSAPFAVTIPGVYPQVVMHAEVSVTPMELPGDSQPASGPFTASTRFFAFPWLLLAVLVALLAIGYLWRRRRMRRPVRRSGGAHAFPKAGAAGARSVDDKVQEIAP